MAKVIMVQGTMSNVGKSLITAGLCRIFKQDGYRTAPFKSQNMALNSYITKDNLEMGRAQAVQAQAAGVEPEALMNPILLKPTTDMGSQVIVEGKPVGNMEAAEYFRRKTDYIPVIRKALETLKESYDIIVIEGAGSPAEINLKENDIVNMGIAKMADAPVLLVGDIDRGGVFAQLIGTVMLLEPGERQRVCGLIINKFRGDRNILAPGVAMLEERCGKPVLGVVPYMDIDIEDEDSLSERLAVHQAGKGMDIAVIRLPKLSNFTDFQALALEHAVSVRYVERAQDLGRPDAVILPGTKSTIPDMLWLRESGLETAILRLAAAEVPVIGICGGYQMLGETITDYQENTETIRGMGLLPIDTVFEPEKRRFQVEGRLNHLSGPFAALSGMTVKGYEIHMGISRLREGGASLMQCNRSGQEVSRIDDGCVRDNVFGTYVHGLFDADGFREHFVRLLSERKGIDYAGQAESLSEYRERQYDKLADGLRENLNMEEIYKVMGLH